jgi:hypothetical protein
MPTCDNNDCINGHNSSSKIVLSRFLSGVPLTMTKPVNFLADGYWHIVINTLKADGPSKGPGSTGSLCWAPQGYDNNQAAYYLFGGKSRDADRGEELERGEGHPLQEKVQRLAGVQQVQHAGGGLGKAHPPGRVRTGQEPAGSRCQRRNLQVLLLHVSADLPGAGLDHDGLELGAAHESG